jgi:polyisoprenoid-binding protein YceI
MRRPLHSIAFAASLLAASSTISVNADEPLTRAIDVARSRAGFEVTHLYVTRVNGRLPILAGSVALAPGSVVPTSISATLDPKHVDTANGDRDDDLQGPDWFETKRFPTWSFTSTMIKPGPGDTFEIDGSLTVHGVAQSAVLTVTTTRGLPHPAYHASGHLDRHAFGMRTTLQDGLIGGDVKLTLDVELR